MNKFTFKFSQGMDLRVIRDSYQTTLSDGTAYLWLESGLEATDTLHLKIEVCASAWTLGNVYCVSHDSVVVFMPAYFQIMERSGTCEVILCVNLHLCDV